MEESQAVMMANEVLAAEGKDLRRYLVTVTEEAPPPERLWRIHYGPRDYRNRRGGDLTIFVDERFGVVQRVVRGQ